MKAESDNHNKMCERITDLVATMSYNDKLLTQIGMVDVKYNQTLESISTDLDIASNKVFVELMNQCKDAGNTSILKFD